VVYNKPNLFVILDMDRIRNREGCGMDIDMRNQIEVTFMAYCKNCKHFKRRRGDEVRCKDPKTEHVMKWFDLKFLVDYNGCTSFELKPDMSDRKHAIIITLLIAAITISTVAIVVLYLIYK